MSYRILIVDANSNGAAGAQQALAAAGHRVAEVSTFEQATSQLALDCPDLLISAIRLKAFNGLHLLLRARSSCKSLQTEGRWQWRPRRSKTTTESGRTGEVTTAPCVTVL